MPLTPGKGKCCYSGRSHPRIAIANRQWGMARTLLQSGADERCACTRFLRPNDSGSANEDEDEDEDEKEEAAALNGQERLQTVALSPRQS